MLTFYILFERFVSPEYVGWHIGGVLGLTQHLASSWPPEAAEDSPPWRCRCRRRRSDQLPTPILHTNFRFSCDPAPTSFPHQPSHTSPAPPAGAAEDSPLPCCPFPTCSDLFRPAPTSFPHLSSHRQEEVSRSFMRREHPPGNNHQFCLDIRYYNIS